jgi:hypothetical protein
MLIIGLVLVIIMLIIGIVAFMRLNKKDKIIFEKNRIETDKENEQFKRDFQIIKDSIKSGAINTTGLKIE